MGIATAILFGLAVGVLLPLALVRMRRDLHRFDLAVQLDNGAVVHIRHGRNAPPGGEYPQQEWADLLNAWAANAEQHLSQRVVYRVLHGLRVVVYGYDAPPGLWLRSAGGDRGWGINGAYEPLRAWPWPSLPAIHVRALVGVPLRGTALLHELSQHRLPHALGGGLNADHGDRVWPDVYQRLP